ncbi:MAG: hypothetical protein N2645_08475 [Clostridia bacterium]|nr:hypothetical protein [Clostridia bacterium]
MNKSRKNSIVILSLLAFILVVGTIVVFSSSKNEGEINKSDLIQVTNDVKPLVLDHIKNKSIFINENVDFTLDYIDTMKTLNNKVYVFYTFKARGQSRIPKEILERSTYYGFNEMKAQANGKYKFIDSGFGSYDSVLKNDLKFISYSGQGDTDFGLILNKDVDRLEFYIDDELSGKLNVAGKAYYLMNLPDTGSKKHKIKVYDKHGKLLFTQF